MAISRRTLLSALPAAGLGALGMTSCSPARNGGELVFGFPGSSTELAVHQEIGELFRQRHPDIPVRFTYADPLGFFQRLPLMFRARTAPDVIVAAESWISGLNQLGGWADLTPLMERDELDPELWLPGSLAPGQIGGRTLCLPLFAFPKGIAYNRDLLERQGLSPPEDGWSENDLAELAVAAAHGTGGDRVWGMRNSFGTNQPHDLVTLHGGMFFDLESRSMTAQDPTVASAIQWVTDLIRSAKAMPNAAGSQDAATFTSGRFAFDLFQAFNLNAWNEQIGDRFAWDVAPFPREWVGTYQNINIAVYAGSEMPEEAWLMAKFIATDPEVQPLLHRLAPPTLKSGVDEWFAGLSAEDQRLPWATMLDRLDGQLVAYQGGVFNKLWDVMGQGVEAVQNLGHHIDEALADVQRLGEQILRT